MIHKKNYRAKRVLHGGKVYFDMIDVPKNRKLVHKRNQLGRSQVVLEGGMIHERYVKLRDPEIISTTSNDNDVDLLSAINQAFTKASEKRKTKSKIKR